MAEHSGGSHVDHRRRRRRSTQGWSSLPRSLEDLQRAAVTAARLFARESDLQEFAPDFESGLRKIFGDVLRAELLPLDAQNAKEFVESIQQDGESFGRILTLIERNSLQAVAGYPTALEYLAKRPRVSGSRCAAGPGTRRGLVAGRPPRDRHQADGLGSSPVDLGTDRGFAQ